MNTLNRMSLVLFAVAGLLVLIGLGIIRAGITPVNNASASTNWPQTQGKVLTSEVKFTEYRPNSRERFISYSAHIVYQYTVNEPSYTSENVAFAVTNAAASTQQQIVNKYPVGATVTVYYAPNDPHQGVLEPGATAGSFFQIIFGGLFILAGLIFGGGGLWLRQASRGMTQSEYQPEEMQGAGYRGHAHTTIIKSAPKNTTDGQKKYSVADSIIPMVVTALLGIVGLVILNVGLGDARDAFASTNWPHTPGTVVSFFLEQRESTDNNNRTIINTPRLVYRYPVNNVTYLGERVTFEDVGSDSPIFYGYNVGSTVVVSYSPDDPSRSVLKPGANPLSFWLLGVGFLFAALGILGTLSLIIQIVRHQ